MTENDYGLPDEEPDGPRQPPAPPGTQQVVEFESFYHRYFAKLVSFLIYWRADLPLAGEIAQEAFRLLWLHWPKVEFRKAWTWKVAKRMYVRLRQTRGREVLAGSAPADSLLLLDPKDMSEVGLRHEIIRILRNLPPVQREIMILTLLEYTPSEIAVVLDKRPEAVRSSLRKARRRIWDEMYGDEERDDDE